MNIEDAQREECGDEKTWDYGVGVCTTPDDFVAWVEIHSADSLHVQAVIDKLDAVREFLRRHAPELSGLPRRFVWLATRNVYITPDSRQGRMLAARGLLLRSGKLDLDSVL